MKAAIRRLRQYMSKANFSSAWDKLSAFECLDTIEKSLPKESDNMPPEDIPEDREESFPCPAGCGGNVTRDENQANMWKCDNCGWMMSQKESD